MDPPVLNASASAKKRRKKTKESKCLPTVEEEQEQPPPHGLRAEKSSPAKLTADSIVEGDANVKFPDASHRQFLIDEAANALMGLSLTPSKERTVGPAASGEKAKPGGSRASLANATGSSAGSLSPSEQTEAQLLQFTSLLNALKGKEFWAKLAAEDAASEKQLRALWAKKQIIQDATAAMEKLATPSRPLDQSSQRSLDRDKENASPKSLPGLQRTASTIHPQARSEQSLNTSVMPKDDQSRVSTKPLTDPQSESDSKEQIVLPKLSLESRNIASGNPSVTSQPLCPTVRNDTPQTTSRSQPGRPNEHLPQLGIDIEGIIDWLSTRFIPDINSSLECKTIARSARDYFAKSYPQHPYIDERAIRECISSSFVVTIHCSSHGSMRGSRMYAGLRLSDLGQRDFREASVRGMILKSSDPTAVSQPPNGWIISAPVDSNELLLFEDGAQLIKKMSRGTKEDVSLLYSTWAKHYFRSDPEYAVDRCHAVSACQKSLPIVFTPPACWSETEFEACLLETFKGVTVGTIGEGESFRAVYKGLRWILPYPGAVSAFERKDRFDIRQYKSNAGEVSDCCAIEEEDFNLVDPHGVVKTWLHQFVIFDPVAVIDAYDLHNGYRATFGSNAPGFCPRCIQRVTLLVFPSAMKSRSRLIGGLRWKVMQGFRLHTTSYTTSIGKNNRREAHKLLYIPQPQRTVEWLRMVFKRVEEQTISLDSMFAVYENAFRPSKATHTVEERSSFEALVLKTLHCEYFVEVAPNYVVAPNVGIHTTAHDGSLQLRIWQHRRFRSMLRKNPSLIPDPARMNVFNRNLFNDPLLMSGGERYVPASTAISWNFDVPIPDPSGEEQKVLVPFQGPFIDRLLRRASPGHRRPFGDEEPGFPGVSMRAVERELLRGQGEIRFKVQSDDPVAPEGDQPRKESAPAASEPPAQSPADTTKAAKKVAESVQPKTPRGGATQSSTDKTEVEREKRMKEELKAAVEEVVDLHAEEAQVDEALRQEKAKTG